MQEFREMGATHDFDVIAIDTDTVGISIFVSEADRAASICLCEDQMERLYEWLGQALGKHPAGVKG
ncbi:hypothetical protein [Thalassospira povalilytica]|uniref:hypothetical protein n=1 Tax=Thalassospira povalilytica TaxID=732237 RepID=UPI001D191F97|nr:hypothetical protein [Thalassospira povalilytica]MCC4240401.1 hypothetical protein [Thalassospira povalilytica]